jgi:hypothetical protein
MPICAHSDRVGIPAAGGGGGSEALLLRKISWLPSALPGLPGVRSLVETKAILVPSELMEGPEVKPPVVLVIWVKVLLVVLKRKISPLPSALPGLPGVRSRLEPKAILVPSALMEGTKLPPPVVLVIWVWVNVCAQAGRGANPASRAPSRSSSRKTLNVRQSGRALCVCVWKEHPLSLHCRHAPHPPYDLRVRPQSARKKQLIPYYLFPTMSSRKYALVGSM